VISEAFAAAKVNLWLHVGPPAASGLHPISSLAVFADVGDVVSTEPGERLELGLTGESDGLDASVDNLVLRAARALEAAAGRSLPPLRLTLDKRLPVAAGLGGGSADAAAALRLLNGLDGFGLSEERVIEAAASLGADVPMCLASRPVLAEGFGERLSPAPALPEIWAVLVNPRAPCPTAEVYRRFDALGARGDAARPALPDQIDGLGGLVALLQGARNDLEAAARQVQPLVTEVLARLRDAPETLFARMSGSGATCFALCEDREAAARLGRALTAQKPRWWVRPCRLGGPWSS
jgi:4-diphosphocytidyl-2-C-methyl-D-erythritol kinase